MRTIGTALALLCFAATAQAQSCYSQSFGAADPYANVGAPLCASQQAVSLPQVQYQTVAVPVTTIQYHTVAVAVPQVQTVAVAVPHCNAGVANYGVGFNAGFSGGFRTTGSFNSGFGFAGAGVNRFGNGFGAVSGTGVQASFLDRRGNQVNAVGASRVDVKRGLFGNIQGVSVDRGRGLFGGLR
jgi:hypothetical protein